jgi:hypothetical protein
MYQQLIYIKCGLLAFWNEENARLWMFSTEFVSQVSWQSWNLLFLPQPLKCGSQVEDFWTMTSFNRISHNFLVQFVLFVWLMTDTVTLKSVQWWSPILFARLHSHVSIVFCTIPSSMFLVDTVSYLWTLSSHILKSGQEGSCPGLLGSKWGLLMHEGHMM